MQSHTITHKGIQGTYIVRPDEQLLVARCTVKLDTEHSAFFQAVTLMYTDALLAGAGEMDRDQFMDALQMLGATIRVESDGAHIHFFLQATQATHKKTLALFETMVTRPHFLQKEVTRIKEHLTNRLILAKEDARARAQQNFYARLTHESDPRYPFSIEKLLEALPLVRRTDLISLHKELLRGGWIVTCGGNESSCNEVVKNLSRMHQHTLPMSGTSVDTQTVPNVRRDIVCTNIPHKHNIELSIGNTLPLTRRSPEFPAFHFGMSVLALPGGFAGRLMSTVREKEGLTYMIYGGIEMTTAERAGYWRIGTFFNPKDIVRGIDATLHQISLMQKKGITTDELRRFKAILHTRFALIEDSLIKKVREQHERTLAQVSTEEYEIFKLRLEQVTVSSVQEAMHRYLNPEQVFMSAAGPVSSVQKELTHKFGATKKRK